MGYNYMPDIDRCTDFLICKAIKLQSKMTEQDMDKFNFGL